MILSTQNTKTEAFNNNDCTLVLLAIVGCCPSPSAKSVVVNAWTGCGVVLGQIRQNLNFQKSTWEWVGNPKKHPRVVV